ncbi:phosphoribulose kinase [Pyrus ussuriensis x Pyrus communis]|uniref:Phosphoribulose kinase n=1 Tax=Pyrus ussuriensis x Pyrus communis TaxID=2448454 RepID=A0A5N5G0L7_9ROSA|nr:phosphoribulose kinase [Pyrus ussuriensis x Pyrus communis]
MWVFISNFSPLKLKLIAKLSNVYFRLFDSNMLISNITTVICLDDYHSLDRTRRKKKGVTILDPRANNFDLTLDPITHMFSIP